MPSSYEACPYQHTCEAEDNILFKAPGPDTATDRIGWLLVFLGALMVIGLVVLAIIS